MKRNWIIIGSALIVLLVVFFLTIRLHSSSKKEVISRFQDEQLLLAHHVAEQVEVFLWGHSQALSALGISASFQDPDEGMRQLWRDIQVHFESMKKHYTSKISLHDKEGITIYSTDGTSIGVGNERSDFFLWLKDPKNEGKFFISSIPEENQFVLGTALYREVKHKRGPKSRREFVGCVSLTIDLKEFVVHESSDTKGLHKIWIIDRDGRVLLHSDHPRITPEPAPWRISRKDEGCKECHISFDYAEKMLKEEKGTISYKTKDNSEKLAAFVPVKFENASWVVVLNFDDTRLTTFLRKSLRDRLILLGIVFFTLLGGSVLIFRNYQSKTRVENEARHWQEKTIEHKKAEEALKESEERLRFLSSQLLKAQERERRRISIELHDELGQGLAALKLRLGMIERKANKNPAELREECEQTSEYLDHVIDNVRRISRDLSPSVLEHVGLSAALRRLLNDFAKNYQMNVTVNVTEIDPFFSVESQAIIYRIFQEVLNNTGKHSQATRFSVVAAKQNGMISFTLEDDGRGFDKKGTMMTDSHRKGMGLDILDERVRMLGGVLEVWSQEGKGTRITFRIPVTDEGTA